MKGIRVILFMVTVTAGTCSVTYFMIFFAYFMTILIPNDILLLISLHFPSRQIFQLLKVSKNWRKLLLESKIIWKSLRYVNIRHFIWAAKFGHSVVFDGLVNIEYFKKR